jgi:excisionase family DNA binding protein
LKDYLTLEELAIKLSVSKWTIINWAKTKGLPKIKIGGSVRYDPADVEKWIKKQNKK